MSGPVLSTMWAQQPRFAEDLAPFSRVARDAGYTGIEVSHSTDSAGLESLLRDPVLPIRSLHAPTPRMVARRGGQNGALNLASTSEEERVEAVEHTLRTIEHAARCGARFVVVHLGGLGGRLPAEARLRELYTAGRIDSDEARAAQRAAHAARAELVGSHLVAARRSLADLTEAAVITGVALGLENRLHFHEIPSAEETGALLGEYPPHVAGYWHDTGHAEVQGRLGLIDPREVLRSLAPRLIGAHLHDVRGILDHRAPGTGDVDWSYIAAALPADAARTLEIDQHEPEASLADALRFLQARGVLAPVTAPAAGEPLPAAD